MSKIAVFASGQGSNLQAIMDAISAGKLTASLELVVSDKPAAFCLTRAIKGGIPTLAINPRDYPSKDVYEGVILEKLLDLGVEYIILAGYMRIVGPVLLRPFANRIINIHPSLLPAFPGKDGIGQALAAGVKETGVTIHYVDDGIDTGPIIAQERLFIGVDETRESLEVRIHAIEHRLYPEVLQEIFVRGKKENGKTGIT